MKHSLVRQTIVETASRLFYHNGYNLTGINEIIKEAGIAKATLYNHFKSKDDVCLAYLQHKHLNFKEEIKQFVEERAVGKTQILALFDFLSDFFQSEGFSGCWCIKAVAEVPIEKDMVRKEIQRQKRELIDFIISLVATNMPNIENPDVIGRQIYVLYEGAVTESYLHQDIWPITSARLICEQLI